MNDATSPRTPVQPNGVPSLEELAEAHRSLRTALHVTLVLLMILTGSLSVFFLREISIARKQMAELTKVVVDYEKSAVPVVEELRTKLQAFARAHPDFAPIYARYFGTNSAPATPLGGNVQPTTGVGIPRLPQTR